MNMRRKRCINLWDLDKITKQRNSRTAPSCWRERKGIRFSFLRKAKKIAKDLASAIKNISKRHSGPCAALILTSRVSSLFFCDRIFNRKSYRARHAIGHEEEGWCSKRTVARISSPSAGRRTPIREELRRRFNSRQSLPLVLCLFRSSPTLSLALLLFLCFCFCLCLFRRTSSRLLSFRRNDVDALDFTQSRR